MTGFELLLFTLLVAAFLFFAANQIGARVLIRRRKPDPADPPSNYGLAYQDVQFKARDGTPLAGWWIPATGEPRGTLIVCHGLSGSMDRDTRHAPGLHRAGFNVLMFDFRGHGRSGGRWVTFGMFEIDDVLGAVDFLWAAYGVKRPGVFGFSMGAATALIAAAAAPDKFGPLACDSAFVLLKNTLARWLLRFGVPYLFGWQYIAWTLFAVTTVTRGRIDQVDPILWTPHVASPVLFIHGGADRLVPPREVQAMIEAAAGPVERWEVPGAGHRGACEVMPDEYERRVVAWFAQHGTA
ncbi:MAG: alpha/beta hydrolase [Anaerolineae bacterium]|nr:alpha/beta hydrolase [Anaerolineae bacterium]